jgi:hypothetical protein
MKFTVSPLLHRKIVRLVCAASCSLAIFSGIHLMAQERSGVNIGLTYPLSTRGIHAGEFSNFLSLNAIGGVSRHEKVFSASGIYSIIHEDAHGFQAAGIMNLIGGFSAGVKTAGLINVYNSAQGFQAAGFMNFSKGNIHGMQASGFFNRVLDIRGFQMAGFFNKAKQVDGTQASGYLNIADDVDGTQLAGYINVAKDVDGAQVAGLINIADRVKGVQVAGLINIADSSEYPIGIINIIRNGEKWIGVTTDDNLSTLITFRSGSKKLYGIVGLGFNPQNEKHVLARQFGLGAHFFNRPAFRLNSEITVLALENFRRGDFVKFSVSLVPAFKLGTRLEIFGGPSLNLINTNTTEGKKMVDHFMWRNTSSHDHLQGLYVGYVAGLHMKL